MKEYLLGGKVLSTNQGFISNVDDVSLTCGADFWLAFTQADLDTHGIVTRTSVYPPLTPTEKHSGYTDTGTGLNITRTMNVVDKTAEDIAAGNVMQNLNIQAQIDVLDAKRLRPLSDAILIGLDVPGGVDNKTPRQRLTAISAAIATLVLTLK